ncbi:MAG: DUF3489 domain-containing protein [Lysobacter sp.]
MIQLTDNQRALILLAVETGGHILNFPDNLRGGARTAVTRSLVLNDLIATDGAGYALTEAGYEAVGLAPPTAPISDTSDNEADAESNAAEESEDAGNDDDSAVANESEGEGEGEASKPAAEKSRKPTRIDQVLALLMRPQGATIKEVMEATDWQQHSVRGFFAGTLKKKGYTVTNEKAGKGDRIYRIQPEEFQADQPADTTSSADEQE